MTEFSAPAIAAAEALKRRTMRRVYAVWFWRSVAPLLAVEFVLLAGVAVGVLTHISLRHIIVNAMTSSDSIQAFVQFFLNNFFVKSIQSRLLFGLYVLFTLYALRDVRAVVRRGRGGGEEFASLLAPAGRGR